MAATFSPETETGAPLPTDAADGFAHWNRIAALVYNRAD
jgi:hypothetical protein